MSASLTSRLDARTSSIALASAVIAPGEEKSAVRSTSTARRPAKTSWVELLPASIRPYAYLTRIEKPVGTMLLYYPCVWSIGMACYAHQAPLMTALGSLALLFIGSFLIRSAGCTVNDIWDRDFDKAVERTRDRPIARGDITRFQAILFLTAQTITGFLLVLQMNTYSIILGIVSVPIGILYPAMKRVTYMPQFILGLVINWGALLGWSVVVGSVNWHVCFPLWMAGLMWTLVYDTIYAHQDKKDDVKVGVRSTALLLAEYTRPIVSVLSVVTIALIAYSGVVNGQSVPFYVGLGLGAMQLAWIIGTTDLDSRESCWKGFSDCGWLGFWVGVGALVDYVMATGLVTL